jgi:hypothetical protein
MTPLQEIGNGIIRKPKLRIKRNLHIFIFPVMRLYYRSELHTYCLEAILI